MPNLDYYEILQVSPKATIDEIKAAFRRLARQYHPDLHPNSPSASTKFREVCEAYEALSQSHDDAQAKATATESSQTHEQDFYVRGVEKSLEKDYRGAEAEYSRAIALNPRFFEAYLKRCEVRHRLGDDRGVLEDCRQLLEIEPQCAPAYYYLGRSRLRLGYAQSAIEAYTEAIRLEGEAQTYYYRGLAYHELKDTPHALNDLQTAAKQFRAQGDLSGYRLAKDTIKNLNRRRGSLFSSLNTLNEALRALPLFIFNPGGGLLPVFARLKHSGVAGLVYGAIAVVCFVGGVVLGWQVPVSLWQLGVVGGVPFVSLVVVSAIARLLFRRRGSLSGDIFTAGATLLPVGFFVCVSGFLTVIPNSILTILAVFAGCYSILTLYSGCTQIANLSEAQAAFVVPVMVLISSWLAYLAFTAI